MINLDEVNSWEKLEELREGFLQLAQYVFHKQCAMGMSKHGIHGVETVHKECMDRLHKALPAELKFRA